MITTITALYGRQSLDVRDSISVEMQIEKAQNACDPTEQCKQYIDKGYSGKNTLRPQYTKLMQDVENGIVKKVVVYRLDRFSRSILDFSNAWEILAKHSVEFVSVNESFDTSSPIGKAMLFIIMVFAQLERETIVERVTDNYYQRAKFGSWMGGPAPYGFQLSRIQVNGKSVPTLEPDREKIKLLVEIEEKYASIPDQSLGEICKELENRNIKGVKRDTWNNVTLSRIFRNPAYVMADMDVYTYYKSIGVHIDNEPEEFTGLQAAMLVGKRGANDRKRKEITQAHLSIANWQGQIPSDIWIACQYKLQQNVQVGNSGKGKHTWLTGIIKCGHCKRAMTVGVEAANQKRRFKCSGRIDHICSANITKLDLNEVEEAIEKEIELLITNCTQTPYSIKEKEENDNKDRIALNDIQNKINNLMECIASGAATSLTIQHINKALEELQEQHRALTEKQLKSKHKFINLDKINFRKLEFEDKKMVVRSFIEYIYIFEKDIEIIWKM